MNALSLFHDQAAERHFALAEQLDTHSREIFEQLLTAQIRAQDVHGHTADRDDELGIYALGRKAEHFLRIGIDRAEGPPQRRILPAARMKALQSIIITIGFIAAIDRQIEREKGEKA